MLNIKKMRIFYGFQVRESFKAGGKEKKNICEIVNVLWIQWGIAQREVFMEMIVIVSGGELTSIL